MRCKNNKYVYGVLLLVLGVAALSGFFLFSVSAEAGDPVGANVTVLNVTSANNDTPSAAYAFAGNVTELDITAYSVTRAWQGYFGNVSGTIQLSDGADNVLYNWTAASPTGQVYMSTNSTITWRWIQCFNFTATGTYDADTAQAGATSLFGTNISLLEAQYNINGSDVDGVDETFSLLGAGYHDQFYTSKNLFSEGECQSTRMFSSAKYGESNKFEEVLMYEPTTTSVIFVSLLERDLEGFDQARHDFEAMVLEDGHGTDSTSVLYYFFVELI